MNFQFIQYLATGAAKRDESKLYRTAVDHRVPRSRHRVPDQHDGNHLADCDPPILSIAVRLHAHVITVIYACYAIGVLGALLIVGNWSDQLGRRRMLLAGLCASAASAVTFLLSHGQLGLMLGRLLSGVSAGIFTGTATVAVIELAPPAWRKHVTLAAAAFNMLGLGLRTIVERRARRIPAVAHAPLLCRASCAGRVGHARRVQRAGDGQTPARAKLGLQRISLPAEIRSVFMPAAVAGFAGFAVVGFFAAVAPQLIHVVLGYHSGAVIGAVVFLLFACSALGQMVQAQIAARWRQPVGCVGLLTGFSGVALCVPEQSLAALLIGTALAGVGQGNSLRAGPGELTAKPPRRGDVQLFRRALCRDLAAGDRPGYGGPGRVHSTAHADLRWLDDSACADCAAPSGARRGPRSSKGGHRWWLNVR